MAKKTPKIVRSEITIITIYDYDVNKRYSFYGCEVVISEIVNHGKGQFTKFTKYNEKPSYPNR